MLLVMLFQSRIKCIAIAGHDLVFTGLISILCDKGYSEQKTPLERVFVLSDLDIAPVVYKP